jgi:PRC-barrel domain
MEKVKPAPQTRGTAVAKNDEPGTKWTGHDLFDIEGNKVGPIVDVRYGDFTGSLEWLVVESGLLGTRTILVPVAEVQSSEGRLVAPYPKDWMKNAPGVEYESASWEEEERNLCAFYGLAYVRSTTEPVEGCVGTEPQRPVT